MNDDDDNIHMMFERSSWAKWSSWPWTNFFNFHVFPSFVARAIMGDNDARCSLEEKDVQSYGRNQY
jgi:hypothetical protein